MPVGRRAVPRKLGEGVKQHAAKRNPAKLAADLPGVAGPFACTIIVDRPEASMW
jgi:hypothetical protein